MQQMSYIWPTLYLIMTVPYQIVSTSLQKKETRKQAKSVKFLTKMVCIFKTCLVLQYKTFGIFRVQFPSKPNFFSAKVYKLFVKYEYQIFFFSCTCLCRVQQVPSYCIHVTAGQDLMNSDQTVCDIWSLSGSKHITP